MRVFRNSFVMTAAMLLMMWSRPGLGQDFDTLRIATFNLLNYPGSTAAVRNPAFRTIIRAVSPDIIIVQELTMAQSLTDFQANVLNQVAPGVYAGAPFVDGPDTDNGLFYKTARISFIGPQTVLTTALRDINGYRLRPEGIGSDSLDIQIYSAHLKAGTTSGDIAARFAEAQILRSHLNGLPVGFFIAGGDFNLTTSSEAAWTELTGSQADNSGRLYDPINTPGNWRDGAAFAAIHTQSTRTINLGDGGATGGLDDRFDFLLPSYNFQTAAGWQYIAGSYIAYGNDGNHLNQDVNNGYNAAVPDSIADALQRASDHLPVLMSIRRQIPATGSLTLLSPNGGEIWNVGGAGLIQWNSSGFSGNVRIDLNRAYPGGAWEVLYGSAVNDGAESWTVSGAATPTARLRISSVLQPAIGDSSNANFVILPSAPPLLSHDPHGDVQPGAVTFTARVTDDLPGCIAKLYYRPAGAGSYDSTALTATGFPNEYAATLALPFGRWEYYLRATDSHGQSVASAVFLMVSAAPASRILAYDDGSAERWDWNPSASDMWAVRFSPVHTPFAICAADVAVAASIPDPAHSQVTIMVFAADGPAGEPGTLLANVTRGSIGNVPGGLTGPGPFWTTIRLADDLFDPPVVTGDFYIGVMNGGSEFEAFGMDTSSVFAGRAYHFDAATSNWLQEDGINPGTSAGNRMIRAAGFTPSPTQITLARSGADAQLAWQSTGAPYYRIYRAANLDFSGAPLVASVVDTTWVHPGGISESAIGFYIISGSSKP